MDAGAGSLLAVDRDGRVAEWTHGAERLFGWTRVEAMYRTGVDLLKLPAPSTNPSDRRQEAVLQRRDGSTFPAEVTQWPVPDGADLRYYIVCRDISERDQRRAGVTIDPLTGLLNRAGMVDRLAERLSRWAGGGDARPALLLLIGLQRFKEIDYSTHHHLADEALRIIGARIAAFARQASSDPSTAASSKEGTALVARVAGDEFAILLDSPGTAGDIARLAEAAADTVSEPFQAGGRRLALTAHVGAAEPQTGSDARSWFGDADAALYRSRHGAGAHFEIEGFARRHGASWRGGLPDEMRVALREGQFELYYQPIFALPERALTGAEALIRWHHPQHGLLLPGAFIDAAEGSGMIAPIGEWVLREAARQLRDWDAAGLRIAVNLGAQQLADPGIVARVIDAVHTVGAASPGGGLTVEMTESVLMTDPAVAATRIGQFRDKGVQVSIDDFGTGYSSLAYLKWFDVDVLKIDMSFVHGLESNRTDAVIVRTIIDLARELNLRVIAEGVETEAQLARLTEWGCTHVQGFGLGRPAPASALTARLRAVR
jgi:diguanylate cyclase (GGDEF)-like protein/PAS domain S-box-containing protein